MKLPAFKKINLKNDKGATVIEYCLIGAAISLGMAFAAFAFGDQLDLTYQTLEARLFEADQQLQ